ncbi:hypothetical protein UACE39S_01257 [Ureibacillus acetophenoni]
MTTIALWDYASRSQIRKWQIGQSKWPISYLNKEDHTLKSS